MKPALLSPKILALSGLVILAISGLPGTAHATDAVACDSTCDSGQKLISYADGNTVTCACVAEAQMDPTIPDPAVVEGAVTTDTE